MRAILVPLALLALVAVAGVAAAGESRLVVEAVPDQVAADATGAAATRVRVALELESFYCFEETSFPVLLEVVATDADARLAQDVVWFQVPEGPYFSAPFTGETTLDLALWRNATSANASGVAEVIATFETGDYGCLVQPDFPRTQANASVTVAGRGASGGAPAPGANETPEASNATNTSVPATNETPTNATVPEEPAPPAGPTATCDTPGCGYMGEYDPNVPEESATVPGFAPAAVLLAGLAVALRRRA